MSVLRIPGPVPHLDAMAATAAVAQLSVSNLAQASSKISAHSSVERLFAPAGGFCLPRRGEYPGVHSLGIVCGYRTEIWCRSILQDLGHSLSVPLPPRRLAAPRRLF